VSNAQSHGINLPIFVEGYFASRFAAGERPNYGYPTNHLPETVVPSIDVMTSFMSASDTDADAK